MTFMLATASSAYPGFVKNSSKAVESSEPSAVDRQRSLTWA
jgi:hypothetical protein